MISWQEVRTLYLREMRAAMRERTVVVTSIVMPIVLYPFILWALYTGIAFVRGQTEGFVSRIVVTGWPSGRADLKRDFELNGGIQLIPVPPGVEDARERLKDGDLDAVVEILPASGEAARLAGNFQVRLTVNESKERSAAARDRVVSIFERYRHRWLRREAQAFGVAPTQWEIFTIDSKNIATSKQMGAFILGLILPIFFVVMVALGCFYPAVDTTAGERERNTWETLMTVAASRGSIVAAKYLYVTTMGWLAGVLNLAAMTLTMKPVLAPILARSGETLEFSVPLAALPIMAVGAVLLAAFVAAGMMIFAAFAHTFKEGQAVITPFYMMILLPVMFLQVPGLEFSLTLSFIPIINVTMMVREAISGTFHWPQIAVTTGVSLAIIALLLRLATFILQFEDIVIGSYTGSFNSFLQKRVLKRERASTK